MEKLRVLVVDDTIVYRKIVSDVLAKIPQVEIVGTANNGKIAISRILALKPDIITLDIEMPEMNGIEVLSYIKQQRLDVAAIMLSTLTQEGSDMTIKALELGAFDFIAKPQSGTMAENTKNVKDALLPILNAFQRRLEIKNRLKGKVVSPLSTTTLNAAKKIPAKKSVPSDLIQRMNKISRSKVTKSEIIGIGISTGGPTALAKVIPMIPSDIGVPILIVQHMPPMFTQSLAKSLNTKSSISVKEAQDGEIITPNTAFIAPGGKQMKIIAGLDGKNRIIKITDDPPENSCKPSVDYLFRSIAHHFVARSTGVIMTGMGSDGTLGLKLMKKNGSFIIAQDEETCTVFGMPREPIISGIVDVIAPLESIANEIIKTVKRPTSFK